MTDNNTTYGHNESAVRLGILADTAQRALERVASGEKSAIEGWLDYGAALNEGRGLFPSNEQFGQWLVSNNLSEPNQAEQAAAKWAAANRDDFATARAAGNAPTVRGIYAKWQEIDAGRKAADERAKAETERAKADAERKIADEANRKAEAERLEAKAQADAEAEALAAVKRAKNAEQRRIAQEQADVAAAAKAEAEATARAEDEKAKAAGRLAKAADKAAKTAGKSAKAAEKKAEKAKAGDTSADNGVHVSHNSGENEWYTPAVFIEAARVVLGGFDLDPASSEVANRTVRAAQIFTAQDDGLAQEWPIGSIWMNPPYAQPLMGRFADRFAAEVQRGSTGIVLVNNATETVWFQTIAAVCSAICFPKSRIKFLDPEGNTSGAPLQGQAIIYCGPDADLFAAEFCVYGLVLRNA